MKMLLLALALVTTTAFAQVFNDGAVNLNFTGRINHAKGVDIASTATVDLNAVAGNLVHVTGASTINSFGVPSQAGIQRRVVFDGINTITYSASTLVIPGSTTLVTAAGDTALIVADTTSKWVIHQYTRKAVAP